MSLFTTVSTPVPTRTVTPALTAVAASDGAPTAVPLTATVPAAIATAEAPAVPMFRGDPTRNGVVYIGSCDSILYALDAATGGERWRLAFGAGMTSAAVLGGMLYIGSFDGILFGVGSGS